MLVGLPSKYLKRKVSTTELLYYVPNPYLISPIPILQAQISFLFHNLELKGSIDKITAAGFFPIAAGVTIIPIATRDLSTSPFLLSNGLVSGKRRRACYIPAVQGGGPPLSFSGGNNVSIYLTLLEALPSWMFGTFSLPSHYVSLQKSAWEVWWRINLFSFSRSCYFLPPYAPIMTFSVRWIGFSFIYSFYETSITDFEEGAIP